MTHTLNRRGLSEQRKGEEMVVLCMVHRREKAAKAEAMKKMVQIVLEHNPLNVIGAPLGFSKDEIISMASGAGVVTAVFNNIEEVKRLADEIKFQELGISVVLSGLFHDVRAVCEHCGLKEHTFHISLGIFGRTEKLPDQDTLEITTQCGHGLISPFLVENIVKKIKKGNITCEEGAQILIKPCVCGIGNPQRISKILGKMVQGNERN